MPAEVVEYPAEIRVRLDHDEEPAPRRGGGEQERALFALERDGLHLAQRRHRPAAGWRGGSPSPPAPPRHPGRCVPLPSWAIGKPSMDATTTASTPGRSASARTTSLKLLMQGSFRCRGESLGILWSAMGEVKKNPWVDHPPGEA